MKQFVVVDDVFWMEKGEFVNVVLFNDPRVFRLEGIAARVFLSVAKKTTSEVHPNLELTNKVLADLESMAFIKPL